MTNGVIYCSRCGSQNSALAKFCANCGTPFVTETAGVEPVAQVVPPPQVPISPPPNIGTPPPAASWTVAAPSVRYGGFWIRFVAIVIDALIVGIVVFPFSALIGLVIGLAGGAVMMPTAGVHLVRGITGLALSGLANWIYEAAMESSSRQATLGKMALGLKVTDLEGRRISFARATGRHFAKILSGMILLIGYIMAGFTQRKQALHDMIAGTLVMRAM